MAKDYGKPKNGEVESSIPAPTGHTTRVNRNLPPDTEGKAPTDPKASGKGSTRNLSGKGVEYEGGTPDLLPSEQQAPRLVNMAPAPAFIFWYSHAPGRWMVVLDAEGNPELLPRLGKLKVGLQALGMGGVDKVGDDFLARKNAEDKGRVLIPWNVIPGGYVRKYDGKHGPIHLEKWARVHWISGDDFELVADTEGYYAFLRDLIARRIVVLPPPIVVARIIDAQQNHLKVMEMTEGKRDNKHPARIEHQRKLLQGMEAIAADYDGASS
jgi:hypothetical protein